MKVAIVIVSYRSGEDVLRCLCSIKGLKYSEYEVIVCENGGNEAYYHLQALIEKNTLNNLQVSLINSGRNLGYAGGVNLGILNAKTAGAWWILNPDTIVTPNSLSELIQRLQSGNCQIVGGVQYYEDGKVQSDGGQWIPWLARAVSLGHGRLINTKPNSRRVEAQLNYITGASMLVSREFYDTVGPMREDYFLYCEEIEWCLRAKRLGINFGFSPDAHVLHYQGTSTGSGMSITSRPKLPIYMDERNKILLTRDCYPYLLPIAAVSSLVLLFGRYVRKGALKQFFFGLEGWKDGLLNRRGAPMWLHTKKLDVGAE